ISAFQAQFADPSFTTIVRETDSVELDVGGQRAAESGRWTGAWRDARMGGMYLAVWRKVTGQWFIESETFVTLSPLAEDADSNSLGA
ncbi:MAG: DUF4440 domain-containing protein, partial [Phenylobacterium sp.]|nr:DUF4440 domain-containing protein [Phenylobacterium sp.]